MKILDRYLWKAVLFGLITAWFSLTTLVMLFNFINETGALDNTYGSLQALIYTLFTIPSQLYELFPTSMLIGSLLGLGNLAAHSEFTAMRAAGFSIFNIIFSVFKLGLILVVAMFLLGEFIVPKADLAGKNFKATFSEKNIVMLKGSSIWLKEKTRILRIGQAMSESSLTNITIFELKDSNKGLNSITDVKVATMTTSGWLMEAITEYRFTDDGVTKSFLNNRIETDLIDAKLLSIASIDPKQLSINELSDLVSHQKNNGLSSEKFELAFWKRFSAPFASLVMLFLAMPFLFGSQRGGGAGQRVFIGIIAGVTFFLLNKIIYQMGSVYGLSPFLSAFLPAILFLSLSVYGLARWVK